MTKLNNLVIVTKLAKDLKYKPKCLKQLYFPYTRPKHCICIDKCKYTPQPLSSIFELHSEKIEDCISTNEKVA